MTPTSSTGIAVIIKLTIKNGLKCLMHGVMNDPVAKARRFDEALLRFMDIKTTILSELIGLIAQFLRNTVNIFFKIEVDVNNRMTIKFAFCSFIKTTA